MLCYKMYRYIYRLVRFGHRTDEREYINGKQWEVHPMKNKMKTNILLPIAVLSVLLLGFVMLFVMAGVGTEMQVAEALEADYYRNYYEG